MLFRSPEARKMAWLSGLTLDERAAKEIRLFDFGDHLVQRYKELAKSFHNILGQHRPKEMVRSTLLSLLTVVSNLTLFAWIVLQAKQGLFGMGAIVMGLQAFIVTQMQISGFMQNLAMLFPVLSFFEKLHVFLSSSSVPLKKKSGKNMAISSIQKGITFENVSFRYPDGRQALSDINLHIPARQKLALVGENGAGKTTLIKLLARLYEPTNGRILVDGVDLREIDLQAWRSHLSAIFQDFGRYHLSARENIALSNLALIDNNEALQKAAVKGGFDQTVASLPQGFDTLLGKEFGGTSLSGGEWQKLAMARVFMREASLLILDEPTAALDPQSEYDVFQRFATNICNKTAVFVTHRLGSVTMADSILVLKNGRIFEQGSHAELLIRNSDYAKMFFMQAGLYQIALDER
jgi:ATP-binding cassette subfamily B protein